MFQFSASCAVLPVGGWGTQEAGRGRARTAVLSWPKGNSIVYDIRWGKRTIELGGVEWRCCHCWDWLAIDWQVVSNCIVHYLCAYKKSLLLFLFLFLVNRFSSSTYKFYFISVSLSNLTGREVVSKGLFSSLPVKPQQMETCDLRIGGSRLISQKSGATESVA